MTQLSFTYIIQQIKDIATVAVVVESLVVVIVVILVAETTAVNSRSSRLSPRRS